MTIVALCLAAKQGVACLLLRSELRLACQDRIELGGERCHLCGGLVAGYRLSHLIEGGSSAAAIQVREMDRQRIVRWRWARLIAHPLHIARPLNGERLCAPFAFEEAAIRA